MAIGDATTSLINLQDRVSVLLPLPLAGAYDYRIPTGIDIAIGDYVVVPLGGRRVKGVVWGVAKLKVEEKKLRNIIGLSKFSTNAEIKSRAIS